MKFSLPQVEIMLFYIVLHSCHVISYKCICFYIYISVHGMK
jgi:hypothetical protein